LASLSRRRNENVAGDFYVDTTCIDCDTCRWMAPATFDRAGEMARVHAQPGDSTELRQALMALVSCPTHSIGTTSRHRIPPVLDAFPVPVEDGVFHLGFHSAASFGAASYLITRPQGNVMVDSPRFAGPLVRRVEQLGGLAKVFLTHRDDVADSARWAARFEAPRILHRADLGAGTGPVEVVLRGLDPLVLDDEITLIPVPGHTRGSVCLLLRERFLFTGDHLAYDEGLGHPYAFRRACWYDWSRQIESMERLAGYRFEWILPGHGRRCRFPADRMRIEMRRCLEWMRRQPA
jgi:glyoxylase-like metal-dependent hydrolase (beta-lactamase superfamily II)/ferredoxin